MLYLVNVVRRVPATIAVGLVTFFVGVGSAQNIDTLINQVHAERVDRFVFILFRVHTHVHITHMYVRTHIHTHNTYSVYTETHTHVYMCTYT